MTELLKRPLTDGWTPDEKRYECLEQIGKGTYSSVFRARETTNSQSHVALKRTLMDPEEGVPTSSLREVMLFKHLGDHPNIVSFRSVAATREHIDVALELMPTTLSKILKQGAMSSSDVRHYMRQLVAGVRHMHARGVMHRDIKPENLLVNPVERVLKLTDLGLACFKAVPGHKHDLKVVTLWYRAPEILLQCATYDTPIDMWSVGCVFSEMARGCALFRGGSDFDQLMRIFAILGTPTDEVWPGFKEMPEYQPHFPCYKDSGFIDDHSYWIDEEGVKLLCGLLAYDPARRTDATSAAVSVYLNDQK